ncbi:MAG: hypothetical protein WEB19_05060, partial [Acidimicrobiia bacterium]
APMCGISDFAFAVLTSAAALFAGLLAWRVPTRIGTRASTAVLAVTVIVIGAPIFGNDFAGMVVAAVAFGLMAWLLVGRGLRALATTAAILVFLALAFFVALVRNDGSGALTQARRAVLLDLPLFQHSVLLGMLFVVGALVAYLWYVPPRPLRSVVAGIGTVGPMMLALVIVAVLGFVLNDPGVSIPGMMAVVLEGAVVHLSARRA